MEPEISSRHWNTTNSIFESFITIICPKFKFKIKNETTIFVNSHTNFNRRSCATTDSLAMFIPAASVKAP